MPQAKPRARTGTSLSPLDRLIQNADENGPLIQYGEDWGIVYAAYQDKPPDSIESGKILVYCAHASDGTQIPGSTGYGIRRRELPYHAIERQSQIPVLVRRLYWRHIWSGDAITPLDRVQHKIHQQTKEKVKEDWQDAQRRHVRRSNRAADRRGEHMMNDNGQAILA